MLEKALKIDPLLERRADPLIQSRDRDGGPLACQEHAGILEQQAKLKVIPGCWEVCGEKPPSAEARCRRAFGSAALPV